MDFVENLTAVQAQSRISSRNFSDIKIIYQLDDKIEVLVIFLGNLLASGNLLQFRDEIEKIQNEELIEVLNLPSYFFYNGTLLHQLTYWNNSSEAKLLYEYLKTLGAKEIKNYYGETPFEQGGEFWVHLDLGRPIGKRNFLEFSDFYEELKHLQR